MVARPSGTVTMLFSDIEGSTVLLSRLGDRYVEALDAQRSVLRAAWSRWGGAEMGTEGDSFFVVFDVAANAARAALQAQRDLAAHAWPSGERVAVRMGLHTGEPEPHDDGYVGMDVHRAARVAATAHGGQVVMSEATSLLVSGHLGDDVGVVDLGRHRLKDIAELEHIFQLRAPGLPSEFPPLKSLGTATNLPRATSPLLGREREVGDLTTLSAAPEVRLVTLTGPGGSGKTRLATAVAAERAVSYPDGAYFVPLAAVTTVDAMWPTLAETLGAAPEDRARSRFLEWVSQRHALLVLDNLEQLPGAADVVGELLGAAGRLDVLSTSRRPLHLQGEHEYPVAPLGLPDRDGVDEAMRSPAVQLFCHHAARVRRGFQLTADNQADVVALCERLDGMPLAIELAAARVKLLSPAALLARLDSTGLAGSDVDRPERQRTLRAAIDWSYRLLPVDRQGFFRRLGVFAGGADLDAVAAVAGSGGDVLDEVAELHDASLITVVDGADGEPRVAMLQTIRDFALERLDEAGELEMARSLHADHYVEVANTLRERFVERPTAGQDGFDLEQANLREVLTWALGDDKTSADEQSPHQRSVGMRMCHSLYGYWRSTGHAADGRPWFERARELAPAEDSQELADLLIWLGAIQFIEGEVAPSIGPLTEGLDMSRRIGADTSITTALRVLGEVHGCLGNFDTAFEVLTESLDRARKSRDDMSEARALVCQGWFEYLAGYPDAATDKLNQGIAVFRAIGAHSQVPTWRLQLAAARLAAGDLETASTLLHEVVRDPVVLAEADDRAILLEQHSLLAAARGRWRLAGLLLGAAEALRSSEHSPIDPPELAHLERHLTEARDGLGATDWQLAVNEGHQLDVEQALAEAETLHTQAGQAADL